MKHKKMTLKEILVNVSGSLSFIFMILSAICVEGSLISLLICLALMIVFSLPVLVWNKDEM